MSYITYIDTYIHTVHTDTYMLQCSDIKFIHSKYYKYLSLMIWTSFRKHVIMLQYLNDRSLHCNIYRNDMIDFFNSGRFAVHYTAAWVTLF